MTKFVVVDRDAMPVKAWASLLSGREQAEVSTFSAPRRDRTVMSRVLVKYLTVSEDGHALRSLNADHINALPHEQLAAVESLSGPAGNRRTAKVSRAGHPIDRVVSSAHCGKYTVAGQSRGRMGVDLERIEERRPEFYRQMFSAEELAWVEQLHLTAGASRQAAFTLLWGIKEAYLKASNHPGLTVWNFSHWTARVGGEVAAILQPGAVDVSVSVPGRIESVGVVQAFEVSARRLGDMLLVILQYGLDGDTERISL